MTYIQRHSGISAVISVKHGLAVGDLVRLDHRTTYRLADQGFDLVKRSEERKLIADAAE